MQNLLAATSTASVRVLIGPAVGLLGSMGLAESMHQNCVLERCVNLCSIVVLHLKFDMGQILLTKFREKDGVGLT